MADQAADVLNQDGPTPPEDNAEASADALALEAGEAEPQANAEQGDSEPEEARKRLGGWQRKLNRAEQERDFWRKEALRGRGKAEAEPADEKTTQEAEAKRPTRPRIEDYDGTAGKTLLDYQAAEDRFIEALTEFKATEVVKSTQQQQQQKTEQQKIAEAWTAQVAEARKLHPDFDSVAFSEEVPSTPNMLQAISRSAMGAELAYELGQHPDEAERIAGLDSYRQLMELGKIEARIAGKKSAGNETPEDAEAPAPPVTKAPKPPEPVRKAAPSASALTDDLPYKEWLRRREAELRKR